ncbi:DKNYY domain-containing protein [uncultured Shewanella sp.]|uniref:DKNYY domain-containing protein n=1 Tax=uncultured Shewanella sp. TaxID=173975 RepID=UPI0026142CF0|nr:DKNYY domain-containing protein [uncultured Shewanella sp.]
MDMPLRMIHLAKLLIVLFVVILTGCARPNTYQITEKEVNWLAPKYIFTGSGLQERASAKRLFDANVEQFQSLMGKLYGKDDRYVYYRGYPVAFADVSSFTALSKNYGIDNKRVFFKGKPLLGANPKQFKVIKDSSSSSYAISGDKGYFESTQFDLCEPNSFRLLKSSKWARDNACVYYKNKAWVINNPVSFKLFDFTYAVDDEYIYYENKRVKPQDIGSFEQINHYYAKDKHDVYYQGKKVIGADPSSFKTVGYFILGKGKDAQYCFLDGKRNDCNTPSKKTWLSEQRTEKEINQQAEKLAMGWIEKDQLNKNEKGAKRLQTTAFIVNQLEKNIHTPAKKLHINNIPEKYAFVLLEAAGLFPNKLTYIVRKNTGEQVSVEIFKSDFRGVMTEVRDQDMRLKQGVYSSSRRWAPVLYQPVNCEFALGSCIERKVNTYFTTGEEKVNQFEVTYKNGVWQYHRQLDEERWQDEYRIYDQYGFIVYEAEFSNDELRHEYIREGFVPPEVSVALQ